MLLSPPAAVEFTRRDIVDTISLKLDFLLISVTQKTPMGKEAMIDLLKLSFNLLCHWPKVSNYDVLFALLLFHV